MSKRTSNTLSSHDLASLRVRVIVWVVLSLIALLAIRVIDAHVTHHQPLAAWRTNEHGRTSP